MKARTRHALLAGSLVVTVIVTVMAPESDNALVAAAPRAAVSSGDTDRARAMQPANETVLEIRPREEFDPLDPTFVTTHWSRDRVIDAPLTESGEEEALPESGVPPLPFRLLGRYVEDGKTTVFLQYHDDAVVAREGEVIDDTYRVDAISDDSVTFLYLPLEEEQTMAIAAQGP